MTKVLGEIRKLSFDERIQLVGAIWDSIAEDADALRFSDEQTQHVRERLDTYEQNPSKLQTWEEIKASLK